MNKEVPLLSTVLKTTAKEITGDIKINRSPSISSGRNLAASRLANGDKSVTVNANRFAQSNAFAGGNINITSPNFYSPFLTPSSFQIPNTRKEVYLWANWWVTNEPKVAAGINFYKNFPFNGWELECQSSVIKDYFEKQSKELNFTQVLPDISKCYHQYGDVFVLASLDCQKCGGSNEYEGEECDHKGARWKNITLLNPDSIMITPGFMDAPPSYAYLPSDHEIKVVTQREPKEQYDSIPDEVKTLIAKKMPIKLNPMCVHHFKHAADPWSDYGVSLIRPLFPTLAYKDKLRQAQWLVAERHIVPIKLIKVGNDQRPASQQDIDSVQEQIAAIANDPNLTLVTHHAFDYEYIGACYSDDTEVLTKDGFKLFKDVSENELIATYDIDSGELLWDIPLESHTHEYDSEKFGPLINFKGKHYDSLVTPNHEMLTKKRIWDASKNKYSHTQCQKVRADDITDHDRFISTLSWSGKIPLVLPYVKTCSLLSDIELNDFLVFAGYYLSEGSLIKDERYSGGYSTTTIYQKTNTESEQRIHEVLRNCFGEKTKFSDNNVGEHDDVRHFNIHSVNLAKFMCSEFGHLSDKKSIPRWILDLPKEQLTILLNALMDGDGDAVLSGNGYKYRYSTTSIILANNVQEIAMKLGYNVKVKFDSEKRIKPHHLPIHRVYWSEITPDRVIISRNIHKVEYKGKVYCFTVKSGVIITRRNGKIGIHGNSGKVLQLTNEYELIDQEILDGLMLNKALLNGEGPTYGNAQVGLIAMNDRLETWRREVAQWIEEKIFKPVAKWNGFTATGKHGDEELVYPSIKFNDLELKDDTGKLQMLVTAQQNGVISAETLVEAFGLNWDQEVERLRFEKGNTFVNSSDIANTDFDLGFSLGAPPMPEGGNGEGMPANPAGGPEMSMGGGTPGLEGGLGAPPEAPAPGGGMAPGASSLDNFVKLAVNTSNSLYFNRNTIYDLNSDKNHNKFVKSPSAVNGRGQLDPIPIDLEPEENWNFSKFAGWPMNYTAKVAAKEKEEEFQPQFFTGIEKRLYTIVLQLNIPMPFYAQYQAGPSMEYQLDGAFPGIRLGLEADGEIWHNNLDKKAKDQQRDIKLARQGWTVLRFTDAEINDQPSEVANVIMQAVKQLSGSSNGSSI